MYGLPCRVDLRQEVEMSDGISVDWRRPTVMARRDGSRCGTHDEAWPTCVHREQMDSTNSRVRAPDFPLRCRPSEFELRRR